LSICITGVFMSICLVHCCLIFSMP
jgi:hypothetical protein